MPEPGPAGGRPTDPPAMAPWRRTLQALLSKAGRSRLLDPQSLRVQLTLRVWLLLIVLFTINNVISWTSARRAIIDRLRIERQVDSEYLAYGVRRWSQQIRRVQMIISQDPDVQRLDPLASRRLLALVKRAYPYRTWRLFDRQGRIVASSGEEPTLSEARRLRLQRQRFFQQSLAGLTSHVVGPSLFSGESCMTLSAPVYPPKATVPAPLPPLGEEIEAAGRPAATAAPVGVLAVCLPLSSLGRDSGLNRLASSVNMILDDEGTSYDRIQLNLGDTHGTAFLLLSQEGYLLFPTDREPNASQPMTPDQVRNSAWGAFAKQALSPKDSAFNLIRTGNQSYLVYSHRVDPLWQIALVVDTATAYKLPNRMLAELIPRQILILLLSAAVIFWTCAEAAWPVQRAGAAVRRIATGDFDVELPANRRDEIGNLYRDIKDTASQLRHFVAAETSYAVTRKQIETARAIQRSFLVEKLPQSEHSELATSFNPALDVAGDWYDVIPFNGGTAIVIADVCDKGIGAALFMSVFRTLLRFELLNLATRSQGINSEELRCSISIVNDYMATTHGDSTMFATVFIAAHDPQRQRLIYVCAGHELPFIVRRDPGAPLERLQVTGPAVGIFPGSEYAVQELAFMPGDALFAFTDGLTDARSPRGEAWGGQRLHAALERLQRERPDGMQALVDGVMAEVAAHMAGAEPFDDLTVIALAAR